MKFALNYSLPAIELLETGEIDYDYIKCPDWPDLIESARAVKPVVVHFDLLAGKNTLDSADWKFVEQTLTNTETRLVNLHFYPSITAHGNPERALAAAVADIQSVARRFGPERVIVENMPYPMPEDDLPAEAAGPQVITQVLEEIGCGLLLDISHARLAARHLGLDEKQFLSALPVDRIREMHLTGIDWHEGKEYDHLAMTGADWENLDWVMEQVRSGKWPEPGYLAFEYGGIGGVFSWRTEREVIRRQVPRIVATIR